MAKKKSVALNLVALSAIVAAGENGMVGPMVDCAPLAEAGLVELASPDADAEGNVQVRATAAGIAKAAETADAPAPTAPKTNFDVVDIPADIMTAANEKRRSNRGGGEKYPFGGLEVGKGFFVAETEKMPDPAKSLASTVSSATARYAEEETDAEGNVVTKMVNVKTYATDEAGKRVKDAEGHFVVESEAEEAKPVMVNTRVFKLVPADGGAWVVRTA